LPLEDGAFHAVGLDDEDVGLLRVDPGCEIGRPVEPQRPVFDPRVEHDIAA